MLIRNLVKRFQSSSQGNFVPKHSPASNKDVDYLRNFIADNESIVVITGAGISTESGIPDYRSEDVGLYARSNHKPIQYIEFLNSEKARQSYWARNYVGWDRFSSVIPNTTHYALRNLEESHKKASCIVTQNVDSLHFKAGSRNVVELHGSAYRVYCLNCKASYDRFYVQEVLRRLNPQMKETAPFIRPDGDVELSQEKVDNFVPPLCESCSGILKPDIVFFGDNVPKERVDRIKSSLSASKSLLVLGSSLSVYSAYRFVLQAVEERKEIVIVNIGPTRADKYATHKISAKCSDMLRWLT